jgi:hypothetical protein
VAAWLCPSSTPPPLTWMLKTADHGAPSQTGVGNGPDPLVHPAWTHRSARAEPRSCLKQTASLSLILTPGAWVPASIPVVTGVRNLGFMVYLYTSALIVYKSHIRG